MKIDHRVANTALSLLGMGAAAVALAYANSGNLGNALIFSGGALAISVMPFSPMPRSFYKLPLNKLADEMARRPGPWWQRAATGVSWLLVLTGLVVAISGN